MLDQPPAPGDSLPTFTAAGLTGWPPGRAASNLAAHFETREIVMAQKPSVGRIVHYRSYGTPGGEFLPVSAPGPRAGSPAYITRMTRT